MSIWCPRCQRYHVAGECVTSADDIEVDDAIQIAFEQLLATGVPKHECAGQLLWRAIYRAGMARGLPK